MKFEEILNRTRSREPSQGETASVLGVSERTFRRCRDRFEADGAEGLYDRRQTSVSALGFDFVGLVASSMVNCQWSLFYSAHGFNHFFFWGFSQPSSSFSLAVLTNPNHGYTAFTIITYHRFAP